MIIDEMFRGVVSIVTGLVCYPLVQSAQEEIMKQYPRWMRYGDHHEKIHIPDAVRNHKVWLLSPDGSQAVQIEYLLARRIRAKQGWYINLYKPELPPARGFFAITDMLPTLEMMSLLASSFEVMRKEGTNDPHS